MPRDFIEYEIIIREGGVSFLDRESYEFLFNVDSRHTLTLSNRIIIGLSTISALLMVFKCQICAGSYTKLNSTIFYPNFQHSQKRMRWLLNTSALSRRVKFYSFKIYFNTHSRATSKTDGSGFFYSGSEFNTYMKTCYIWTTAEALEIIW